MRILVICQYYYPEPFRITDICEELVLRGHEVQVVTGYPNYPEGILYSGYGFGKRVDENINGVDVHRSYTIPRGKSVIKRFLNYYSYVVSSIKFVNSSKCISSVSKPFDVVFCNQLSPVMMAHAAIHYKKKNKTPIMLYCLDLWPESLVAGGISRNSVIYKYYHYVSKKIYRKMDRIAVSSRMFSEYLTREFGINKKNIEYLPQHSEEVIHTLCRKKETGNFDFVFAGNIGPLQSIETILEAAKKLRNKPVKFHIVGGGSDYERVKNLGKQIDNVVFYGRRPLKDMQYFYELADAMIVTMKDDPVLCFTLPGKVQSYLAAGKPIIGAIGGESKKVIEDARCGFCGEPENVGIFVDNISKFIEENTDRLSMGKNAHRYYEDNYRKEIFMNKLENFLSFNIYNEVKK